MGSRILPFLDWLPRYERSTLSSDLSAGTVVAVMLIPQGMAYAMLAGLPPVMGLYASTFPLIVYALFGSSRQLAVGPVAMVSLLIYSGLSALAEPGSEKYVQMVLLLSFMVGFLQVALGLLRFGFFINFFSHAVISGFSSAAAIVICLSQLDQLLGIKLATPHSILPLMLEFGHRIGETHTITLAIGGMSLGLLILSRRKFPRFPAPLLVLAASTAIVYLLRLDQAGVRIVGRVPRGLPAFSFPPIRPDWMISLLPLSLTILFVGFMESISVAKWIAVKEKYKINSNQELNALGLANAVASFFSGHPVTGGFSRTAVNYQSGAKTGLASLMTAGIILVTLVLLTPLFHYLPKTILASIVIVAVAGLVDVKGARHLFRVRPIDGWIWVLTFGVTLAAGAEKGILFGVIFSLVLFIWRSAHPHTAELGYVEKEGVFRNIKRYPEARTHPETVILRVDASLYFANMSFLEDVLQRSLADRPGVRWVIMDLSGVNDVDAVAVDTLTGIMENYETKGVLFLLTGMKGPVRDRVKRAGWDEKYGKRIAYLSIHQALQDVGLT